MPLGVWDVEWLSENSQRRYPLAESSGARDETSSFRLPDDTLVDLTWAIPSIPERDPTLFHLSEVVLFAQDVILRFGYDGTSVVSIPIQRSTHVPYQSYTGFGVTPFEDSVIRIVVGPLDNLFLQPGGRWIIDTDSGRILPTLIRPHVSGVSALVLNNNGVLSRRLQGVIELIAGRNMRLDLGVAEDMVTPRIQLDAISGEGLVESCDCTGVVQGPPIRTISGVGPDQSGNVSILGDECISIETDDAALQLKDLCGKPCCGCEELNVVLEALRNLSNSLAQVEGFAQRLETQTSLFRDNILASRLGAPGACS